VGQRAAEAVRKQDGDFDQDDGDQHQRQGELPAPGSDGDQHDAAGEECPCDGVQDLDSTE
jgi:hypothetical protein